MQSIKAPFFHSRSRPATPTSPGMPALPVNSLIDSPPSRPPSPPATPRSGFARLHLSTKSHMFRRPGTPTASTKECVETPPVTSGAGSAYLANLGLKLGEAVSKALTYQLGSPTASSASSTASFSESSILKGRKPLPAGRGLALGALIAR